MNMYRECSNVFSSSEVPLLFDEMVGVEEEGMGDHNGREDVH